MKIIYRRHRAIRQVKWIGYMGVIGSTTSAALLAYLSIEVNILFLWLTWKGRQTAIAWKLQNWMNVHFMRNSIIHFLLSQNWITFWYNYEFFKFINQWISFCFLQKKLIKILFLIITTSKQNQIEVQLIPGDEQGIRLKESPR